MNKVVFIVVGILAIGGMIAFDFFVSRFIEKPDKKDEPNNDEANNDEKN